MSPIPSPRRIGDPITRLPRPRASHHDRHHLFWTGADFRTRGLNAFRDLPCTSSYGLDPVVHSLVHQRFGPIPIMRMPGAAQDELHERAARWLDCHRLGRCGCRSPSKLCAVDALTLEAMPLRHYEHPPCTALLVDGPIYELMRDYYVTEAPVTQRIRDDLARRCDAGQCGCMVEQAGRLVRDPAIRRQLLRSTG